MSDKKKNIKRIVEVTLTTREVAERGIQLAKESKHHTNLTVRQKKVAQVFKNKLESSANKILTLTDVIDKGYEMREMEVRVVKDYTRKMKFYYSTETGALVDQEKFTEYDHQTSIEDEFNDLVSVPTDEELADLEREISDREEAKRKAEEKQEQDYQSLADLADKTSTQLDNMDDANVNTEPVDTGNETPEDGGLHDDIEPDDKKKGDEDDF